MAPTDGRVQRAEAQMVERVQIGVSAEHDVAPTATVTTGRATLGNELLAPERDTAVSPASTPDVKADFIDEVQGDTDRRIRSDRTRRATYSGRTLTNFLSLRFVRNCTTPSVSAKRVSSLPRPTFDPG